MSFYMFDILGASIFPAIIGMAMINIRRKPGQTTIPRIGKGGGVFFLKTWTVAFLSTLLFSTVFDTALAFGGLILPAACSLLFAKWLLDSSKPNEQRE